MEPQDITHELEPEHFEIFKQKGLKIYLTNFEYLLDNAQRLILEPNRDFYTVEGAF